MAVKFRSVRIGQSIFDIDTEVAHGALDLRVPEQDLHGSKIASLLVNDRCLRTPKRMGAVVLRSEPDAGHPFIDKARVLTGAHVCGVIDPARDDEVVERSASGSLQGSIMNARPSIDLTG